MYRLLVSAALLLLPLSAAAQISGGADVPAIILDSAGPVGVFESIPGQAEYFAWDVPWPNDTLVLQPTANSGSEDPGADIDAYGWVDFSVATVQATPTSLGVDDRLYALYVLEVGDCDLVGYLHVVGLGETLTWYQADGFSEAVISIGAQGSLEMVPVNAISAPQLPAITQTR